MMGATAIPANSTFKRTPAKINMEHNNGGLEGDFPFHISR